MHRLAKEFAAYCERNFDFEGEEEYIKDACGYDLSNEEYQELFADAVFCLSEKLYV